MSTVTIHQAKTNLSKLIQKAAAGEEVIIATKVRLGKLATAAELVADFCAQIDREGFHFLAISAEHGIRGGLLPGPHKGPFDRMLIAQSQAENIPEISNKRVFEAYGVRRMW